MHTGVKKDSGTVGEVLLGEGRQKMRSERREMRPHEGCGEATRTELQYGG